MSYERQSGVRQCPHCRASFAPGHGNQRFCSGECREAKKRRPAQPPRKCAGCGDTFRPANPLHETCGLAECQRKRLNARTLAKYYATKVPLVKPCIECGLEFAPGGARLKCAECRAKPAFRGLALRQWKGCAQCGAGFTPDRGSRFCSRSCWGMSRAKPPRVCVDCGDEWLPSDGPESQAASRCWPCRKPVANDKVYANVQQSLRRRLILRAGGRCEDCGTTAEVVGEPLHAHHVEPQALDGPNTLENLRLLCPDCHVGSGWWRNHWQLVAAGLVVPPIHAQAA